MSSGRRRVFPPSAAAFSAPGLPAAQGLGPPRRIRRAAGVLQRSPGRFPHRAA